MWCAMHVASKHKSTCNGVLDLHTKSPFDVGNQQYFLKMRRKKNLNIVDNNNWDEFCCPMLLVKHMCARHYHTYALPFFKWMQIGKWFRTVKRNDRRKNPIYSTNALALWLLLRFHTTHHSFQCFCLLLSKRSKCEKYVSINGSV